MIPLQKQIFEKRQRLLNGFDRFLNRYDPEDHMEKTLEDSQSLFERLSKFIHGEQTVVFPKLQKNKDLKPFIDSCEKRHREIEKLQESALMMHIDEPHQQFLLNMGRIKNKLRQEGQLVDQYILNQMEKQVSPDDMDQMSEELERIWEGSSSRPQVAWVS